MVQSRQCFTFSLAGEATMYDDNYESDYRVRAGKRNRGRRIDEDRMVEIVTIMDDDGYGEEDHELPIKFEVCHICDGRGKHVNPSIDSHGIGAEEFYEDPDFAEEYMSGAYDVPCYCCGGRRVAAVIDRDKANPAILAQLDAAEDGRREYEAECRAERRMGA
jgi:hypothetical protein